ncbi:recombinase family protein [Streptomyces sclerotialus]|uniref:recombinase family protein n=1 Tax=Streptomyces sclerotialus TaxID=1957 RepID=UPI0018C91EDE
MQGRAECKRIFSDKISTRIRTRPEPEKALKLAYDIKEAAPGQEAILTVHELKRLAHNAAELMTLSGQLQAAGVQLELLTGPLTEPAARTRGDRSHPDPSGGGGAAPQPVRAGTVPDRLSLAPDAHSAARTRRDGPFTEQTGLPQPSRSPYARGGALLRSLGHRTTARTRGSGLWSPTPSPTRAGRAGRADRR